MTTPRVVILASGGGSTAEAFIKSCSAGEITAEVISVISNKKNAGVFEKVNKLNEKLNLNIQCHHIGKTNYPTSDGEDVPYGRQTQAEENAILDKLRELKADLVLLFGYMKLVGDKIVAEYGWNERYRTVYQARMLNTHPGLLPYTKGLFGIHIQQYVLINNKPAGHCIFAVDGEYDDGPVISEHAVTIEPGDTPEILFERIKQSEKKYLAEDLQDFISAQMEYNQNNE
jgi:phosphoribosylglycinamide formyltransferase 1